MGGTEAAQSRWVANVGTDVAVVVAVVVVVILIGGVGGFGGGEPSESLVKPRQPTDRLPAGTHVWIAANVATRQ